MSPGQKKDLEDIADKLYEHISRMHDITGSFVRSGEEQKEHDEIVKARHSLRTAAMTLDALLNK